MAKNGKMHIKKGDVVRIKLEWLAHIDYLKPMRVLNIENLLGKGLEIRALDHNKVESGIRKNLKETEVHTQVSIFPFTEFLV